MGLGKTLQSITLIYTLLMAGEFETKVDVNASPGRPLTIESNGGSTNGPSPKPHPKKQKQNIPPPDADNDGDVRMASGESSTGGGEGAGSESGKASSSSAATPFSPT